MNSSNQAEEKKVIVPFDQLRLLFLLIGAKATTYDEKKVERLQKEAAQVGIKM